MSDAPFDEALLTDACAAAFAPLPRSDQRECGAQFVRALLTVRGRKSIRNVAAVVGGRSAYQRMHHFVSASTWDWTAVRRAAAGYLERMAPPEEWVLHQTVIRRSGFNIVGAERRNRGSGRVRYTQRALGLWGVSRAMVCPVDWQLDVPQNRLHEGDRRDQVSATAPSGTQGALDSALRLCREAPHAWGLSVRPVLMDARDLHATQLVRGLLQAGVPFLLRVGDDFSVVCDDPALAAQEQPVAAAALLAGARRLQRPADPTTLAATVRVTAPSADGRRSGLTLLGIADGRNWPAQVWLSDRRDVPLGRLLRWTRLLNRLDHELTGSAPRTGLFDFSGRSFEGWHRHMTLVSVAQLVAGLCRSELGLMCDETA